MQCGTDEFTLFCMISFWSPNAKHPEWSALYIRGRTAEKEYPEELYLITLMIKIGCKGLLTFTWCDPFVEFNLATYWRITAFLARFYCSYGNRSEKYFLLMYSQPAHAFLWHFLPTLKLSNSKNASTQVRQFYTALYNFNVIGSDLFQV